MKKKGNNEIDRVQLKRTGLLLAIIAGLFILFSLVAKGFFSWNTLFNIVRQNTGLAVLSLGITFIIMLGGTDLSSGSNVAFTGAVAAFVIRAMGGSGTGTMIAGFAVSLLVGALIGSVNGFCIGVLKISPFMATLAMMSISRGLAILITDSKRIVVENKIYTWLGQTSIGKVPVSLFYLIALFLIMNFILKRTTFGRNTYAVGGNPAAAKASGINVEKHTVLVYMLGGLFAALASIITVGRSLSAHPLAAEGLEFDAITAVVIGGTSLAGGVGTLGGTMLGAVVIGVIFTGLGMTNINPYFSYVVKGILIIFAVYMDQVSGKERVRVKVDDIKVTDADKNLESLSEKDFDINEAKVLELRNITKVFPGVKALDGVNLKVERGRVHAICGENGAGKSTLMKILSGVYKKDGGEILINGKEVEIHSPMDSERFGISIIYQELALVPELSIAHNIFLGKEVMAGQSPLMDTAQMKKKASELTEPFNLSVPMSKKAAECTVGQQQMVEIAKAISSNAWVVVMDEPTSAITESDKERLFDIVRDLKSKGMAIIYISHRMSEIFEIADDVTVLRDGQWVMTEKIENVTEDDLIRNMVGRSLNNIFDREKTRPGEIVLEVKNLYRKGVFEPISFNVRAGEVLGMSGLIGAGRTEIARCIFGLDKADGGEIFLNGKKLQIRGVRSAIENGIAYVSEDRRREGIVPLMNIKDNMALPSFPRISNLTVIDEGAEKQIADTYVEKLAIKTPSLAQAIGKLSGGNQQKVLLGRWLACDPKLIILDEPTRGIDVGAKAEIHKLIGEMCKAGVAVIMISSEMPEIIGSSDRIIVLYEGKKMAEFPDNNVTQDEIMRAASGISLMDESCVG